MLLHAALRSTLRAASRVRPRAAGAAHHPRALARAPPPPAPARRPLSAASSAAEPSAEVVEMTFVDLDGDELVVEAAHGATLLDVAQDNDVELEGACGGELACSTCHVVLEQKLYDQLEEKSEEEEDMLDLAFELEDTSRLGCQLCVDARYAGAVITVPPDGF